ncbi:MAG: helix-turn-helix domain-containing protein [Lachnospiraceae bacterium]|nr:helix-turn-helix domain-containing protein [Lachnospiraceae bacterium]
MYEKYAAIRDKSGVTDYKVSKDTGIPKSTFSAWKSGKSNPKLPKLIILANYFCVPIDYFLDDGNAH